MSNRPRVLVFESDEVLRTIIFTVLRYQDVDVDTAADGETAATRLARCDYALAIADLDNDDDDLQEFFEALRRRGERPAPFVIALRNPRQEHPIEPDVVSAILLKPIEIDTLAEVARECAHAVGAPAEGGACPPAESEVRSGLSSGGWRSN